MTKRIMRSFKLSEISGVDRPAQKHATVAIIKREGEQVEKCLYDVSRFAECLSSLSYIVNNSEAELKLEADGSLVPQAMRTWLREGAQIFHNMASEEVAEFVAGIAKRDFSASERKTDAKSGAAMPDGSFPIHNASDLHNAMVLAGKAKNPAAARRHIKARAKSLGLESKLSDTYKSESTMSKLSEALKSIFSKSQPRLMESIQSIASDESADQQKLLDETLKQYSDHVENEVVKAVSTGSVGDTSEDEMTPALKKALGLADTATEAEVLKAIADKDESIAKHALADDIAKSNMDADERKHHDALKTPEEQKTFRGLSKAQRVDQMTKQDNVPESVRKALEENAVMKAQIAGLVRKDRLAGFEKMASEMGVPVAKAELLMKAEDGDKTAIAELFQMMKVNKSALDESGFFKEFGSGQGVAGDAMDQLLAKAAEYRKAHPDTTQEQAFAKVYEDPANAKLVAEERRDNRPAAA